MFYQPTTSLVVWRRKISPRFSARQIASGRSQEPRLGENPFVTHMLVNNSYPLVNENSGAK